MAGKKDDTDGIGKVSKTGATKGVKATEAVSEVDRVKGADAVKGVSAISRVQATSGISSIRFEQREKLLSMVSQEAEKLAAQGIIPKSQREVVEKAVQMVIDAALVEAAEEDANKKKS
ncbi:MAG: hypothetical protein ACK5GN_02210 [Pseudomonadota bacterium]|jgi:hypothetical protein